jgi:hypothetical protein
LTVGFSFLDDFSFFFTQSSLLSNSFLSSLSALFVSFSGGNSLDSGVWIKLVQMLVVGQWVSLLRVVENVVTFLISNGSLDFI